MSDSELTNLAVVTFAGYASLIFFSLIFRILADFYSQRLKRKEPSLLRESEAHFKFLNSFEDDNGDTWQLGSSHTLRARAEEIFVFTKFGVLWNMLQIGVTVVSCYAYVHELYEYPNVPTVFIWVEWFLTIFIFFDFVMCWFIAYDKVFYFINIFPFVDWITCIPYWITYGYGHPFVTLSPNEYLTRSLRFLRALRALRLYRLIPKKEGSDAVKYRIAQFAIALVVLWYICASTIQFTENNFKPIPGLTPLVNFYWHTSLYFTTASLTGTGYGDLAPRTEIGRGMMILFLLANVTIIPYFLGTIVALMATLNVYDRGKYEGHQDHILIIGHLRAHQLRLFLSQWYHEKNGNQSTRVVIVSTAYPDSETNRVLTAR